MKGRIKAQMFSFDQSFQPYQKDDFAFMQDPVIISNLQVLTSSGSVKATSVKVESVPCTVLSMTLFDRLSDYNIVRSTGSIQKCFDEFCGDFTVSDELRKMLLIDDSDNYCIYSDSERDEFLFRLFKHLCLGGQYCQFEDMLDPYTDMTKQLYKDLISVQKNPETKELNIISSVYKISAFDEDIQIYPSDSEHEQTFAYLVVDPLKRHVHILYHKFGGDTAKKMKF
ncbi:hypothetical protein KUTeg_011626 [Tegillarca granosa]|uniref:Cilia- and flagella-associated protein 300 n=1 Tax=Tegillarca granosa TaxID=220873 RepID=A0ABQ9F0N6_TEGGR|nr:hypothetical protein KUTeg_011626 [Tegillarca granosa]